MWARANGLAGGGNLRFTDSETLVSDAICDSNTKPDSRIGIGIELSQVINLAPVDACQA
jgi:hypothetical protein